ncbi:hypothetical protein K2173_001743 [Erythroxylum novogranatense]|uniref:Uncharacterized protein n=1 Tax=Erythroxylum novogranatense TaxID=1862640 RepID=A0AAV8S8B2_9ROSI|nr:hypothetical protein K2173_001743 [Erythroxylum novogranatense]
MAPSHSLKVLEHFQISPSPSSAASTNSLALSCLDIPWLLCDPSQRLFFYDFPHPTLHFMNNILPSLKTSLSLTLHHFFPLAATLISPRLPHKPYIVVSEGDSVPFAVAESKLDFNELIGDHVKDVRELHPFVPKLSAARETTYGTCLGPLLALQITVFPNSGLCIGIQFNHVAADGVSINHFMKFWASVFRAGGDMSHLETSLPSHDRTVIKDPCQLESIYLKHVNDIWMSSSNQNLSSNDEPVLLDKVRATFVIGQQCIQRLKDWVTSRCKDRNNQAQQHFSTFAVTCAILWVNLGKLQQNGLDNDKMCYFYFLANCRNRLETNVPANYFGNCLAICQAALKKRELLGENGVAIAASAIGNKIKELEKGALLGAENWLSTYTKVVKEDNPITVAGSPKLRVYDTDFGWGRPKKSEVVHIDVSGSISLSESRDGGGGIEVGLALTRTEMEVFAAVFEQHLKQF